MHAPDHADLLLGVADVLRESVLVELDDGVARRQLKAALHILERVGRSVHRTPGYLVADIDDMLGTLADAEVVDGVPATGLEAASAERERIEAQGWSTPFEDIVGLHGRAQELVVTAAGTAASTGADEALADLYRRMVAREAGAFGLGGAT